MSEENAQPVGESGWLEETITDAAAGRSQMGLTVLSFIIAMIGVIGAIVIVSQYGRLEIPGEFGVARYVENRIAYHYAVALLVSALFWSYLLAKLRRVLVNQSAIIELLRARR